MHKKRNAYVLAQLGWIQRQKPLEQARRRREKLAVRVFNRGWQILTREIVKDLCQQDLRLCDDVDVWWRSAQEECRGLTKEAEKRGDEAIEDEVDLSVEFVGPDLRTPVAEDGVCRFEDAEVNVVFCGREGEDELLVMVSDGHDVGGLDARR